MELIDESPAVEAKSRFHPDQLDAALNAIKFTNEGSVQLNIADTDSDFIFSVTDTGIGIKEEDLEAIFDSFK